jgi:hypothetical protein
MSVGTLDVQLFRVGDIGIVRSARDPLTFPLTRMVSTPPMLCEFYLVADVPNFPHSVIDCQQHFPFVARDMEFVNAASLRGIYSMS